MTEERGLEPRAEPDESTDAGGEPEVEIISIGDEDLASPESAGPGATDAERELAELRERHLRLRADFENFRKRIEREREERARRALIEPIRELLPVVDNLDRAAEAEGGIDDLRHGVAMIARQFAEVLRRFGVEEVPALGLPFDPQVHEAVAREESDEVEVPTVIGEMQKGFLLHDRLLRPSMVRVAVPAESVAAASETADGTGGEE